MKRKIQKEVLGALKAAKDAHPEIDYAGLETSIVKRVVSTYTILRLLALDEDLTRTMAENDKTTTRVLKGKPMAKTDDMYEVCRYGIWDRATNRVVGDFLKVGKKNIDLRKAVQLEYERCKKEHPKNSASHMRPMFHSGSEYGAEILALFEVNDP